MGIEKEKTEFEIISPEVAKSLMESEKDYMIVDVRTKKEYQGGHVPGAICIPNETIGEDIKELPDKNQLLLIYCQSGIRSRQASGKMAKLGYTNIKNFGAIVDWKGDLEK